MSGSSRSRSCASGASTARPPPTWRSPHGASTHNPIRRRLEDLVRRAGAVVYHGRADRASLRHFFTRTYWVRIAERPRLIGIAVALLFIPALMTALWAINDPSSALDFIPRTSAARRTRRATTAPPSARRRPSPPTCSRTTSASRSSPSRLGITAGIGTAVILAFNGLLLGAVAGGAIEAGNGRAFLEFIIPHGPIELSCVIVAAAAGLRLGWAIADPGYERRRTAVAREGRDAVEIVLGTMPWLVAAGLSEAFVRGSGLPLAALATIGLGLFAIFWGLVYTRGALWLRAERARADAEAERVATGPPAPVLAQPA